MVCAHAWSQLSTRGVKDDGGLSPRSSRNGCPKNRQKKGKLIGANADLILYHCFVQRGVWGPCGYDCGSDLCLGIDAWQESRESSASYRLNFGDLESQPRRLKAQVWVRVSVFPICKDCWSQPFSFMWKTVLKEGPNASKGIKYSGLREPGL